jgi:uncharacterized RDD family membrane protein YckC
MRTVDEATGKDALSVLPTEARPYQGAAAGVATRVVASTLDGVVVGATLLIGYAGYVGLRLVLAPRSFHAPDHTLVWVVLAYLTGVVFYLTVAWWVGGRTLGDRVMGLQVVVDRAGRLGLLRALARAGLCVVFPVGLLWCAVNPERRSIQDVALRTAVVYNWLPRA